MDAIADLQLMTHIVISERMFLDHFPSVLVRRVAWLRSGMHACQKSPVNYPLESNAQTNPPDMHIPRLSSSSFFPEFQLPVFLP